MTTAPVSTAMNQKNLNYEIETASVIFDKAVPLDAMNQKNLNYEIETGGRDIGRNASVSL